ncbi:erythropoietin isoform X2 [Corythoichthys intestinalis]|uniref:erythropoietin isoform X2 n=1 Tax=Corythoichthys intestinalis TaxID=161448 RepID=UPI0025A502B0|nr:erythropoietin isoform X2 [Corythoichthys intestinalis]
MDLPGLLALLLMVLEWTCPSLPSPLRPICDLRVLNHFIKEAQDAKVAMKSCRDGCTLSQSVSVPQTSVDPVWESKNALEKAQEVQCGLRLLQQALSLLRSSVTNVALHSHVDNLVRSVPSIDAVLHRLNIPEYTPPEGSAGQDSTWRASTAGDLLQVHINFLRGKVRLLLTDAQACQQDVS